jgi:hypothetical protein
MSGKPATAVLLASLALWSGRGHSAEISDAQRAAVQQQAHATNLEFLRKYFTNHNATCLKFATKNRPEAFREMEVGFGRLAAGEIEKNTLDGEEMANHIFSKYLVERYKHTDDTCYGMANTQTVDVVRNRPFTRTSQSLWPGNRVTITATGRMDWCTGGCPHSADHTSGPEGRACTFARMARDLPCWSLIGKIGEDGIPFLVGADRTITADREGDLYLGVNDGPNDYADNTGRWSATLRPHVPTSVEP